MMAVAGVAKEGRSARRFSQESLRDRRARKARVSAVSPSAHVAATLLSGKSSSTTRILPKESRKWGMGP